MTVCVEPEGVVRSELPEDEPRRDHLLYALHNIALRWAVQLHPQPQVDVVNGSEAHAHRLDTRIAAVGTLGAPTEAAEVPSAIARLPEVLLTALEDLARVATSAAEQLPVESLCRHVRIGRIRRRRVDLLNPVGRIVADLLALCLMQLLRHFLVAPKG